MFTATLGGLIKDYRIKKRLSQLEVSLRIGWKDTSRLSKIEQGRVGKPTTQTLDKIINALELDSQERNSLLMASRILPTETEIRKALDKTKVRMESFESPVILIDYSWRTFFFSETAKKIFKTRTDINTYLLEHKPNWLEILFNQKRFWDIHLHEQYFKDDKLIEHAHEIAQYKYEHQGNTHEKWYINMLAIMSKNKKFMESWNTIQPEDYNNLFYEYENHTIKGSWTGNKEEILNFHVFAIHPSFDYRYFILIYLPSDDSTSNMLSKINKK